MDIVAPYLPDIIVHGVAGFFGSLAVVYLYAALTTSRYAKAQKAVFVHLEELATTLPKELQVIVAKYIGYFGAFVLIIALAIAFGFVGKMIVPSLAGSVGFFGNKDARLWAEQRDAIYAAEERLQSAKGLAADSWSSFQDSLGRYTVRGTRALVPFAFVLALAGAVDVMRRQFVNRGLVLSATSVVLLFALLLMWTSFQGDYVRQLRVAYGTSVKDVAFPSLSPAAPGPVVK